MRGIFRNAKCRKCLIFQAIPTFAKWCQDNQKIGKTFNRKTWPHRAIRRPHRRRHDFAQQARPGGVPESRRRSGAPARVLRRGRGRPKRHRSRPPRRLPRHSLYPNPAPPNQRRRRDTYADRAAGLSRPAGGQILICTAGEGWYQEEGREAVSLTPGMVVTIPAGVRHWHGAKRDSWFSHIAVEVPGEETSNEWCEPVDGAAYNALA